MRFVPPIDAVGPKLLTVKKSDIAALRASKAKRQRAKSVREDGWGEAVFDLRGDLMAWGRQLLDQRIDTRSLSAR